jgi:hypothetical protein
MQSIQKTTAAAAPESKIASSDSTRSMAMNRQDDPKATDEKNRESLLKKSGDEQKEFVHRVWCGDDSDE